MRTHTYTHTQTHTHTNTHTHTQTHKHKHTQTQTHTNTNTNTHKHKHTNTHKHAHTKTRTHPLSITVPIWLLCAHLVCDAAHCLGDVLVAQLHHKQVQMLRRGESPDHVCHVRLKLRWRVVVQQVQADAVLAKHKEHVAVRTPGQQLLRPRYHKRARAHGLEISARHLQHKRNVITRHTHNARPAFDGAHNVVVLSSAVTVAASRAAFARHLACRLACPLLFLQQLLLLLPQRLGLASKLGRQSQEAAHVPVGGEHQKVGAVREAAAVAHKHVLVDHKLPRFCEPNHR